MHVVDRAERRNVAEHLEAPGLRAASGFGVQISDQALKAADHVVIYEVFSVQAPPVFCASRAIHGA